MTRITTIARTASFALLSTWHLAAQDLNAEPLPERLLSIRADGVQELLEAWPNTLLGKLMADEDVVGAANATRSFTQSYLNRRTAVLRAFMNGGAFDDMELQEKASIYMSGDGDVWDLFRFPMVEMQRAEMIIAAGNASGRMAPAYLVSLACSPRHEGRWTQAFELEVAEKRNSGLFDEVADAKVGGFPAYVLAPTDSVKSTSNYRAASMSRWMQHMPGVFFYGSGNTQHLGAQPSGAQHSGNQAKRPAAETAGLSLQWHVDAFRSMLQRINVGMAGGAVLPVEFSLLGLDRLKMLEWSGHFVGERIQDELSFEFHDQPAAMLGALLAGSAKLPAQALPKGAIAQLRMAVNMDMLIESLGLITDDFEALEEVLGRAFDGGIALSCCAPPPGGVIPRIYASINVADEKALDDLLGQYLADSLPTKRVRYSGIECTVLKIPDMPNGIQPAFCRVDGMLHLAESALSLRAFLKVQDKVTVAMDVGDAPLPLVAGDVLTSFDWRFDEAQLYKCYYNDWMPLYELAGAANAAPVKRKDMPEPEVVELYCGKARGVMHKRDSRYTVSLLGALGGPEIAALAMTWGPILCVEAVDDYYTDDITRRLAEHKLALVQAALLAFQAREQRLPEDLGELFTTQNLADDALLLPADDLADSMRLSDGRIVKSSFRYFAKPVEFQSRRGVGRSTILIEIRTHRSNRATLTVKGKVPDGHGQDNRKPIDQFGKGGAR